MYVYGSFALIGEQKQSEAAFLRIHSECAEHVYFALGTTFTLRVNFPVPQAFHTHIRTLDVPHEINLRFPVPIQRCSAIPAILRGALRRVTSAKCLAVVHLGHQTANMGYP